jgi:hypothetical protein
LTEAIRTLHRRDTIGADCRRLAAETQDMDALEISWPCPRCAHPADDHGYDNVCAKCEEQKRPFDALCSFSTLYPAAALMSFPKTGFDVA